MQKLINWFSRYYWVLAACVLLAFIPLYPKIPLIHVIRSWVYIRLEDFLVVIALVGVLVKIVKERKFPKTPLTTPLFVYWGIGCVILIISLVFIGPKLMGYFPHLAILHYIRRIEYMMVFFIGFLAVKERPKLLPIIITVLSITVLAIVIYGIGQKYMGWPAFLTMNEEFAKGVPLRLPPTARIASTFGGHYDLAAYLVLVLPLFASLIIGAPFLWQKAAVLVLFIGLFVMLLLTASRISFGVYLISMSFMLWWHHKRWAIIPVIIVSIVAMNFISGTSERFLKTLRFSDVIIDLSTGQAVGTLDKLENGNATIQKIASPAEETLPKGSGFVGVANTSSVPAAQEPVKVIKTIEIFKSTSLASASGEVATISGSFLIQKALVYDISITTRFQGQWPKAMKAFERNILFGSGFSTLSVASDGDYHRMLGETGIVGTIAFLGIFLMAFVSFFRAKDLLVGWEKGFVIGIFAGLVGLLFNASLIDVFEASKVAFTLWIVLGISIGLLASKISKFPNYFLLLKNTLTHPIAYVVYLFLIIVLIYRSMFSNYFVGDDFTWLRWAAQSSFGSIGKYFTEAQGFFYRPLPKLWYFILFSVFWLKPGAYHVMSILLLLAIVFGIRQVLKNLHVRPWITWMIALLFGVLAIHHENIYWISGQSSLLASFFMVYTVVLYQRLWLKIVRHRLVVEILALCSLFACGLCYDGASLLPVIIVWIGYTYYKRRNIKDFLPLLLIPFYWLIRSKSGAVGLEGDYGYNFAVLPINSLANTIGYIFSFLFGPQIIELAGQAREFWRSQKILGLTVTSVFLVVIAVFVFKAKRIVLKYVNPLLWFVAGLIALLPYIGLGGMAERYVFAASIFWIISLGIFLEQIAGNRLTRQLVIGFILLIFVAWNTSETIRLGEDWKKAGKITEDTLLIMKKQYFPLPNSYTFVFINTPIRHGRAWVFSVGLKDALWHMYRQAMYRVAQVDSPKQAWEYPAESGYPLEPLIFENYILKKSVKEVQTLESK
jgi:hypothetical protein